MRVSGFTHEHRVCEGRPHRGLRLYVLILSVPSNLTDENATLHLSVLGWTSTSSFLAWLPVNVLTCCGHSCARLFREYTHAFWWGPPTQDRAGSGHASIHVGTAEQFWGVMLQFPPPPAVYVSLELAPPPAPGQDSAVYSLLGGGGVPPTPDALTPLSLAASGVEQWTCLWVVQAAPLQSTW